MTEHDRGGRTALQDDNVIDNKKVRLKDQLLEALPLSKDVSIAVGYFFISGLSEIIKPLQGVDHVRLLISNTTDMETAEALMQGFHSIREVSSKIAEMNFVNDDRKETIIKDSTTDTAQSLAHMDQTTSDKDVVTTMIELMKLKKLEVKVYPKGKLHAKAYIFLPKSEGYSKGMGIVGSSNLSISGIYHNSELNLKTRDTHDINQLIDWFDGLWDEGIEFTESFNIILKNSWAGKTYSPKEMFLKASYLEHKDKLDGKHEIDPIWGTTFPKLFPFQKNAVDQCLTMFENYGGVIIADVVGLGKTYVGTALLKYLQLQEYRPLIICPPALKPMWEKFCSEYEVDAKILSRGKLSQSDFDLFQHYKYKDRDLVLIDESHHFRNNNSRQYENLNQFMQARDASAILLTATPFSNDYNDIKNQVMLFHKSEKTLIPPANETDIEKYFRQVRAGKADLVDFLRNIMIRRTRRYVLSQWGKKDNGRSYLQVDGSKKYFPERIMKTQRYDIDRVYQSKYEEIVGYLDEEHLTFARYGLGLYLKDEYKNVKLYKDLGEAGRNLVGLIRILLLKRMESSLEAFKKSIRHYICSHRAFLSLLNKGIIPIGDVSYKAIYENTKFDLDSLDEPETIEEFKKLVSDAGETRYKLDAFDTERLAHDIEKDIDIFEEISKLIDGLTWKTDDKLAQLQKLLDKDYAGKKVLIFTEFAATAEYLHRNLKWDGICDHTDSSTGNSIQCARRFDPVNNPDSHADVKKFGEISLLVATDVLSEGVNLQTGQVVINYDFHWNPTRLIQRAGRIDRIGSENEHVIVHNFLLDPRIEDDLGLEVVVGNKIRNIQKVIGEDYKILTEEEMINPNDIYAIYKCDERILDREDRNDLEPTKFEKILRSIQINDKALWEKITSIPDGVRSSDYNGSDGNLLLVCERGSKLSGVVRKYYLINSNNETSEISNQQALMALESNDDMPCAVPKHYDDLVSAGWNKFLEESEQIEARESSISRKPSQNWVLETLLKISNSDEFENDRKKLDALRKGYSIPIVKGRLNRELLKIKNGQFTNHEIVDALSQLYLHYDLSKQVKKTENETKPPRILYSKYTKNYMGEQRGK